MHHLVVATKNQSPAYSAAILGSIAFGPDFKLTITEGNEVSPKKSCSLDGVDLSTAEAIDAVIKLTGQKPDRRFKELSSNELLSRNFKEVIGHLETLNSYLATRSFFDQGAPGPTDACVYGALRANPVVGPTCKSGTLVYLFRWYSFVDQNPNFGGVIVKIQEQIKQAKHQDKVKTSRKKESEANYDIGLVGAEDGKVVTRFPPEPSGYMHIGHAKAAILNEYFARAYHGKLIMRFDDTNPSKEKEEYTDSILADTRLLGIEPDMISYSSDYFKQMYDFALQLIKEGKAYCDDTPQELMREQRGEGIPSARRDRTVEENLRVFEEMKNGTIEGRKNCLRAKISVDDNNKTLRDPVIYRCNLIPHARTGDQWKMYPTYDFCVPIVDSLEGVTHALRTIEYTDRNAQYEWMLKALNLRHVHIWDFSRVNFVRTLLSKRKLQWFVDTGRVSGWDDPRFPTVRGVLRRGMTVEGLRKFIIQQGPSRNVINLDWSLIWNVNKKVIDPVAPRYTAIRYPVQVELSDHVETHKETRQLHKKNPDIGTKEVWFSKNLLIGADDADVLDQGEEFTLMDWGNCVVDSIEKDCVNVSKIKAHLHLDGDFKKTKHKVTWLADVPENVKIETVDFDHLITKDKLEEGDKVEDYLTPQTVFKSEYTADFNVGKLPVDTILQFERVGYFRVDKVGQDGKVPVLFNIPDGKVVSRYGAKK